MIPILADREAAPRFHLPGKRVLAGVLALLLLAQLTACSSSPNAGENEVTMLSMGTAGNGETMFLAGAATATAINNMAPWLHVDIELSKGALVNARNVSEGKLDLAMVSGAAAYEAVYKEKEDLCALGACYPEASLWIAKRETGLSFVHDVKGKTVSTGTKASETDMASRAAFAVMGIDEENTVWEPYGLTEGTEGVRDGWADAAHAFSSIPVVPQRDLAEEMDLNVLSYTEEEIEAILNGNPTYSRFVIPANTYRGQESDVLTFAEKVLLCTSTEMDEETAYAIAKALDEGAEVYTGGHEFMAAMQDKSFLADDLPIPLHKGAERYYREMGYLKE